MTNLHMYIDQNEDNYNPDVRNQLVVDCALTPLFQDFVTSVELHISDPDMETWREVLRNVIKALEKFYGYEFDMKTFEK